MPSESALRHRNRTGYELIETMRWQHQGGFVRLQRHLARMDASAKELGFDSDPADIDAALSGALSNEPVQRIRLAMTPDGRAIATSQPFTLQPADTVWRIRLARTQLHSGDRLLRHKTSRREVYEAARAEFTHEQANEVILLNERGELCEGTITTLFLDSGDGGPLLTPALTCGLLAGVLRAELLEKGRAVEAILTPRNLTAAKSLYVGNSLRGLIRAICL